MDVADKRGQLIRHLEEALALSEELDDGPTGYLIERALDEARAGQFRLSRKMIECVRLLRQRLFGLGFSAGFEPPRKPGHCGHLQAGL